MNRAKKLASATALTLGLASGGYFIASAATSEPESAGAPAADFGTNFASVTEQARSAVSNNEISIEIWRDGDDVCIRAKWFAEGSVDEACDSLEHLATGTSYIQHSPTLDGERLVLGIVPDGVGTVRVGDESIPVSSNVWYTITDAAPDGFAVASADGKVATSAPIASPIPPENTAFVRPD